ncbi:MAG: hypothetical protein DRJ35_08085 [Thermoprotei archaeon]|nr:MAG: hypothetical protein DRJ35_08085 [Thermoprotei archaeon]
MNEVDCAIAVPYNNIGLDFHIKDLGLYKGIRTDYAKMMEDREKVIASGRTTCVREGYVAYYPMAVNVNYGISGVAVFWEQIGFRTDSPPFILGGDSGSLALDLDHNIVALRFAGDSNGVLGIGNRIDLVLKKLNLKLL